MEEEGESPHHSRQKAKDYRSDPDLPPKQLLTAEVSEDEVQGLQNERKLYEILVEEGESFHKQDPFGRETETVFQAWVQFFNSSAGDEVSLWRITPMLESGVKIYFRRVEETLKGLKPCIDKVKDKKLAYPDGWRVKLDVMSARTVRKWLQKSKSLEIQNASIDDREGTDIVDIHLHEANGSVNEDVPDSCNNDDADAPSASLDMLELQLMPQNLDIFDSNVNCTSNVCQESAGAVEVTGHRQETSRYNLQSTSFIWSACKRKRRKTINELPATFNTELGEGDTQRESFIEEDSFREFSEAEKLLFDIGDCETAKVSVHADGSISIAVENNSQPRDSNGGSKIRRKNFVVAKPIDVDKQFVISVISEPIRDNNLGKVLLALIKCAYSKMPELQIERLHQEIQQRKQGAYQPFLNVWKEFANVWTLDIMKMSQVWCRVVFRHAIVAEIFREANDTLNRSVFHQTGENVEESMAENNNETANLELLDLKVLKSVKRAVLRDSFRISTPIYLQNCEKSPARSTYSTPDSGINCSMSAAASPASSWSEEHSFPPSSTNLSQAASTSHDEGIDDDYDDTAVPALSVFEELSDGGETEEISERQVALRFYSLLSQLSTGKLSVSENVSSGNVGDTTTTSTAIEDLFISFKPAGTDVLRRSDENDDCSNES